LDSGGGETLQEIVETHAGMVRRIATVYERHPDRVDDLMQDVWIAVWQALPRLNDQANLKSYVARITQNICVTHVRRALVRRTDPLSETLPDPSPPLDEVTAHAARLACLIEAVRSLPENLKVVASLYLEEMPIKDIALALGISESNVSVRLHRAKSAIRQSLGDAL
jgi:RNA polymerase sigma factor (sigma-70 family)